MPRKWDCCVCGYIRQKAWCCGERDTRRQRLRRRRQFVKQQKGEGRTSEEGGLGLCYVTLDAVYYVELLGHEM